MFSVTHITTRGVDLLGLPQGALLHLGASCVLQVTGLRNPCRQLDDFQPGLMQAVLDRNEDGSLLRRAGIMSVVEQGGQVRPGDRAHVELPPVRHVPLGPV